MKVVKNTGGEERSFGQFLKWFAGIFLLLSILFTLFIYVFLDPLVKKRIIRGVNSASDGLYVLEIGTLDAKFWSSAIAMDEVWLKPNQETLRILQAKDTGNYIPDVNLYFDSVSISHIAWFSYLLNRKKLEVGNVLIHQPDFIITTELEGKTTNVREENQNFLDLLPGIIAAFTGSLQIEEIYVRNGKLHYDLLSEAGIIHQIADSVFIDLRKIKIDTVATQNALYSEWATFELRNYRLKSPQDLNTFKIDHVLGRVHDSSLVMEEIYYYQKDSLDEKYQDKLEIKVDGVQGRGVQYGSLLKDQKILLRAMVLQSPYVNMIASEDPVNKYQASDTTQKSMLDEVVPYISGSFHIDTLLAENGKIRYQIKNAEKSVLQKADDVDLLFSRVLVDTLKTKSKVFAEDIQLSLKDYRMEKDTTSRLSIATLQASVSDSLFNFKNISFSSSQNGRYKLEAEKFGGHGVDFLSALDKRKGVADSLFILNPEIEVYAVVTKKQDEVPVRQTQNQSIQQLFYDLLGSFSDASLKVENFYIGEGNINYKIRTAENLIEQKASDIRLLIHGIRIDSSRESFNNFYDNFFLRMNDYQAKIHEDNFKVLIKKMSACSQKEYIQMDDLTITQIESFGPDQKTYFINTIDQALATGFNFEAFINEQKIHSSNMNLRQMNLRVFLDTGKPERPDYVTRMPNDLVKSLPFYLRVDTLDLFNSYVAYENDDPQVAEAGKLTFEKIRARATNLTNDSLLMTTDHPARFEARALLMGEGDLSFHVRLPLLTDKLNGHYGGYLGSMEVETFNNFLSFAGLRVEEGKLDSSVFHVDIQDGKAKGELLLLYNDLEIKVIDPGTQEVSRLKSLIGNIIVKNSNPPDEGDKPEVAELSSELQEGDGFFYFLWRVVREGVVVVVTKSTLFDAVSKQ